MRRYVHCPSCGHRNDRAGGRRLCADCRTPLPKRRVAGHARTLRDMAYKAWAELSVEIHGGELEACGVCGRMPSDNRHHDRDHDHETGKPRGLACGGDFGCNRMMPRTLTAERAREAAAALILIPVTADAFSPWLPRDMDSTRAHLIACYLERVESYYAKREAS